MSRWQRLLAVPAKAGRAFGGGIKALGRGLRSGGVAIVSPFDLQDCMLFGGCGLIGYGLYEVYPPAAFIVPGAIFAAVATFGTR